MITPDKIAELRRVQEAATPGPWHADTNIGYYGVRIKQLKTYCEGCVGSADFYHEEDADFIATFNPVQVKELLDEIERLRAALEKIATIGDGCEDYIAKEALK